MNKIPTAEEQLEIYGTSHAIEAMKEFAKLHVEAALKAAHCNHQLPIEDLDFTLNSYPLNNIK
jgi:hypothetical protein